MRVMFKDLSIRMRRKTHHHQGGSCSGTNSAVLTVLFLALSSYPKVRLRWWIIPIRVKCTRLGEPKSTSRQHGLWLISSSMNTIFVIARRNLCIDHDLNVTCLSQFTNHFFEVPLTIPTATILILLASSHSKYPTLFPPCTFVVHPYNDYSTCILPKSLHSASNMRRSSLCNYDYKTSNPM